MIPSHLKLARALEQLLRELAPDAKTDDEFAELALPHLLGEFCKAIPAHRVVAILDREFPQRAGGAVASITKTPAPSAVVEPPASPIVPCWRISICARTAIEERFDPAPPGAWRPVCPDHAKGATPMELRPLGAKEAKTG